MPGMILLKLYKYVSAVLYLHLKITFGKNHVTCTFNVNLCCFNDVISISSNGKLLSSSSSDLSNDGIV